MPEGPGKYDKIATIVREMALARAAIVIVVEGIFGSGFSVQGPEEITAIIPKMLRFVADEIEKATHKMYVIIDLDHSIANTVWRAGMIGHSTWDEYYVASKDDKPFQHMVELINAFIKNGDLVIALTDRNEKYRAITVEWLVKNNILVHDLLMRPDDSYLKSNEMKIQLLRTYFNSCFDVVCFVIDDNEETLLEFQKLGITTMQVRNVR